MSRQEFGIERLIPPWSTNPDLPAGQPYADRRVEGHYRTREAAENSVRGWEPGTWRLMSRAVTEWEPDDDNDNGCPGHSDGPVLGETFYCDGSCQSA